MLLGIFLVLGAALSHATSFIFRKRGLEAVNYKVFILLRTAIGIFLIGFLLWLIGPGLSGLSFKSAFPFIITGGLGGGLATLITTTLAIHEIGASNTHALTSASPLMTALLELMLLGEVVTLQLGLGTLFIVIGASFISLLLYSEDSRKSQTSKSRPLFGLSLAFYTTVAIGIHPVLQKWGLELGATPLQGLFIQYGTASFLYGWYLIIKRPAMEFKKSSQTVHFLMASIGMTLVPLLTIYALVFLSATVVAALMRIAPLFTVILSYFFLKGIEEVSWKIGMSALLIVAGAVLVTTG